MRSYQSEFLDFAIGAGALGFGQFKLKSGRQSPYFFNTGSFNTGARLAQLGRFYAHAILDSGLKFDMLYGPAYKGIPLVAAAAIALADQHGRDVPYAFNRKEAKDHAEGGINVGSPLQGEVLIIDDVISAGLSIGESTDIIRRAGAITAGVVIALNRQERGAGKNSAVAEVESRYGLKVASIVTLDTLVDYLSGKREAYSHLEAIRAYRDDYGA
ncbi:MAG: orotate phosphoribosyltransferase [Acidiferrobacterales bacterium]